LSTDPPEFLAPENKLKLQFFKNEGGAPRKSQHTTFMLFNLYLL